jgi:alkaline phosphatase
MSRSAFASHLLAAVLVISIALQTRVDDEAAATATTPTTAASTQPVASNDDMRELQATAIKQSHADWGYWGPTSSVYAGWSTHSNRLIPVYTFGMDLNSVRGEHSVYRDEARLKELYGYVPVGTLNEHAEYFDQTDVCQLQQMAVAAGKKRIILFIFDGTDWQTTWAAATYAAGEVKYREGRGRGLHLQDYRGVPTDFGFMVTSPHDEGTKTDVNSQKLLNPGGKVRGGFDFAEACETPWGEAVNPLYMIGKSTTCPQAYTDSSASATSMNAGVKIYNDGVNVDYHGKPVETIARQLQRKNWSVGAVTSVPISHATPACTYAVNVWRDDYQDLTRDLLGLPSISHPDEPMPGMDVVIGTGWGETLKADKPQGANFVPGNRYLTEIDKRQIDARGDGKYAIAERTPGASGKDVLAEGTAKAIKNNQRLLGFFGSAPRYHLPFRTADGNFDPTIGVKLTAEQYTDADLYENPRLSDIAGAALDVLSQNKNGFWLMIEAGDVDWGNHDNNIDNAIGAALDGDAAVKTVTDWIENHGGWNDTVLIVTADHGHYFHLLQPEVIAAAGAKAHKSAAKQSAN